VDLLSELPPEPRYPDSSRVIPQHLRNASTAAWHLVEPGVLEDDPGALKRYLVQWLGWREYEITPAHEAVLWELITEEMARVPSRAKSQRRREWKEMWLSDPEKTINHLKINIPKRLWANNNPVRGAIGSASLGKVYEENAGEENHKRQDYLEDFPGGKEGVKLLEHWMPEGLERFLHDLRSILTRRQYQVLERLVRGKKPKEIAKELGISVSSVSEAKTRALSREDLKEVVKRHL
jgi:DNA-binding CsgD family transcriptional regulator